MQLCGFGRRCNRLRYWRLWRFGALCPLHVNGTLDGLKLGFSGLGPVPLVACLGKRVLIHPRHAVVVTAGRILDNVLQDATPTLFGGLLALGFLLTCYGLKVRLSTDCRCLLLLRTLCSFNGCKLVYDVGIFGCGGRLNFLCGFDSACLFCPQPSLTFPNLPRRHIPYDRLFFGEHAVEFCLVQAFLLQPRSALFWSYRLAFRCYLKLWGR